MKKRSRRRIIVIAALAVLFVWAAPWFACAAGAGTDHVDSLRLVDESDVYDGKEVVYRGEVVGDILNRGEFAWVAVNDDHYSRRPRRRYAELRGTNTGIGVYCPRAELDDVRFLGSYGTIGDLIEVRGTFYKSSAAHGGDLCIVAERIDVLRRGYRHPTDGVGRELFLAAVLLFISLAVAALIVARRGRRFRE